MPHRNHRGQFVAGNPIRNGHPPPLASAFLALHRLEKDNPELADLIASLIQEGGQYHPPAVPAGQDVTAPTVDPAAPRKPSVRWQKTARGDARIWTARLAGHDLRVERKKTAKGIVFDAYRDHVYQHRSKSSVTARDRLAYELAQEAIGNSEIARRRRKSH